MYYCTGAPAFGTCFTQYILAFVWCLENNKTFMGMVSETNDDSRQHHIREQRYNNKKGKGILQDYIVSEKKRLSDYFGLEYATENEKKQEIIKCSRRIDYVRPKDIDNYIDKVRDKYLYYEKDTSNFVIGIHIRRGDVPKRRYISIETYEMLVKKIMNYAPKNTILRIFCDGKIKSDVFESYQYEYYFYYDIQKSWDMMINSDIFIMSNSGFSWFPGYLNRNNVIYFDEFILSNNKKSFPPLKSWIKFAEDTIDTDISNIFNVSC